MAVKEVGGFMQLYDVIHIEFRGAKEIERWVVMMADRGFSLPDRVPDESFSKPPWMQ